MNGDKIILDLCGGTGAWSKPYKDAGYDVRCITMPEYDVRTYNPPENVYGILCAPPCTMFSFARTNAKKPRNLKEGMECVKACLNIIWFCMEVEQETKYRKTPLKFWVLENPKGMLEFFLGKPAFEFNPYDFGDQYQKRTCLWGHFNEPKKNPIELSEKQKELHKTNSQPLPVLNPKLQKEFDRLAIGKLDRRARRAITPPGFAQAFFEANK